MMEILFCGVLNLQLQICSFISYICFPTINELADPDTTKQDTSTATTIISTLIRFVFFYNLGQHAKNIDAN